MTDLKNGNYLLTNDEIDAIDSFLTLLEKKGKNTFSGFHIYRNETLLNTGKVFENTVFMRGFSTLPFIETLKTILNNFIDYICNYDSLFSIQFLLGERNCNLLLEMYKKIKTI